MAYLSPFDAQSMVTWSADRKSARVNRYGFTYSQMGHCGQKSFPTEQEAREAYEKYLAETRAIYSTPRKGSTGKYQEIVNPVSGDGIESRTFVNLKANGKPGAFKHKVSLFRFDSWEKRIEDIRKCFPNVQID